MEYQVKKKLQEAGFNVTKSGGSRGDFDLVAVYPDLCVLGIQIKRGYEKWKSPIDPFGCFFPVLIRRLPGKWVINIQTERSAKPSGYSTNYLPINQSS